MTKLDFKRLWESDLVMKALVAGGIPLTILAAVWSIPLFSYLLFVLVTAATNAYKIDVGKFGSVLFAKYRTTQLVLQTILFVMCLEVGGVQALFAASVAWWTTACDRISHLLKADNKFSVSKMSIFWVLEKIGITAAEREINTMALLGFILGFIISIL